MATVITPAALRNLLLTLCKDLARDMPFDNKIAMGTTVLEKASDLLANLKSRGIVPYGDNLHRVRDSLINAEKALAMIACAHPENFDLQDCYLNLAVAHIRVANEYVFCMAFQENL